MEFVDDISAEDEDEGVTVLIIRRRLLVEGVWAGDGWALARFFPFLSRLTGGSISSSSEELLDGWDSFQESSPMPWVGEGTSCD